MHEDRGILRRDAERGRYCAHMIGMTRDVYLRVQSLHFENIIISHRLTIIGRQNSSSNRTISLFSFGNPPGICRPCCALCDLCRLLFKLDPSPAIAYRSSQTSQREEENNATTKKETTKHEAAGSTVAVANC